MNQVDDPIPHRADTPAPALTGDLAIAAVPVDGGGVIGLVPCPGRNHVDGEGRRWLRDLRTDLAALEAWGAVALVTLVEDHEFAPLGVADFEQSAQDSSLAWYRLPITDMTVPGPAFEAAWLRHGADIVGHLARGERIVVHCAGGLGRTGLIAAKLLIAFGTAPDEAIKKVRQARPGAIETITQETYVLDGPLLQA